MTTYEQIRSRLASGPIHGISVTDEERRRLDEEMDQILKAIARSPTMEDAEINLKELGRMEELLATLFCRYRLELSEKQHKLIQQYDRWDEPKVRAAAFKAITKGDFPFHTLFLGEG